MRRLIKKRHQDTFYAGNGKWTPHPAQAKHFSSLNEIQQEQVLHRLYNCCSVLFRVSGGSQYDVEIAL